MKPRDVVVLGAVVVLIGLAAYDAVRGSDAGEPSVVPTRPATTERDAKTVETPPRLPRGALTGELLYVDVGAEEFCGLRLVSLRTGEEARYPQDTTGCTLSAPPKGTAVAKSVRDPFGPNSALHYRIIDPEHTDRPFIEVHALGGVIHWSPDGRRALWCANGTKGFELELPRTVRPLDECASGYATSGEHVSIRGRRIFVGKRLALERPSPVEQAVWAANGFVALVVGRRLERWSDGRLESVAQVPEDLEFRPTSFAPDNCAALVMGDREVHVVDLGCFAGGGVDAEGSNTCERRTPAVVHCFRWNTPSTFFGHNPDMGAWSPDGNWIAILETDAIVFHRVVGPYSTFRWEVRAATLGWR